MSNLEKVQSKTLADKAKTLEHRIQEIPRFKYFELCVQCPIHDECKEPCEYVDEPLISLEDHQKELAEVAVVAEAIKDENRKLLEFKNNLEREIQEVIRKQAVHDKELANKVAKELVEQIKVLEGKLKEAQEVAYGTEVRLEAIQKENMEYRKKLERVRSLIKEFPCSHCQITHTTDCISCEKRGFALACLEKELKET